MSAEIGLVERLEARVADELADLAGQPFALLDFPDHANVGDSAIWLGEIVFFRRHHRAEPRYVASIDAFSAAALRRAHPEGPILIHGGGNFGDLWPRHQTFRERLLETFPDRLIVQLPQSVHYQDPSGADRTARAIARHGNVRLLVRDQPSLQFAAERFACPVRLCPDLALCLGALDRPAGPEVDVLCLLRTDRERAAAAPVSHGRLRVRVTDWLGEARLPVYLSELSALGARLRSGQMAAPVLRLARYEAAAGARVDRGCRLLASGRLVVTDRLHAHLLSLLLGIPHAALDNSYGKVGRFLDAWTGGAPSVHRVGSADEGLAWAQRRLCSAGKSEVG
jgi:exopolysaccharide biosynthesis predicted pyruvyltransferase EpsI